MVFVFKFENGEIMKHPTAFVEIILRYVLVRLDVNILFFLLNKNVVGIV